jgi:hypothetical protein
VFVRPLDGAGTSRCEVPTAVQSKRTLEQEDRAVEPRFIGRVGGVDDQLWRGGQPIGSQRKPSVGFHSGSIIDAIRIANLAGQGDDRIEVDALEGQGGIGAKHGSGGIGHEDPVMSDVTPAPVTVRVGVVAPEYSPPSVRLVLACCHCLRYADCKAMRQKRVGERGLFCYGDGRDEGTHFRFGRDAS